MRFFLPLFALAWLFSCQPTPKPAVSSESDPLTFPEKGGFQVDVHGKSGDLFLLSHPSGIQAAVTSFGGRVVSLWVKDQKDQWTDVVLGFDSVAQYQRNGGSYGAIIGRYGNRISGGKFTLDGKGYSLPLNDGPNTLHGGNIGFSEVVWDATQTNDHTLVLKYRSADGEMGFPGNLDVTVTYTLTDDRGLMVDYEATTDAPTVINLTNHAYFNLNGEGNGDINNHLMQLAASRFTPVDSTLIPTGELAPVAGTPFDFLSPVRIGERLGDAHPQVKLGRGYDHNFVLDAGKTDTLHPAAVVVGDLSGIRMEILTREPGIQFYGGNFMNGSFSGKTGKPYGFRQGFCLETQHYPDSPNQPSFPSTVLRPGESYRTQTLHRFSVVGK
jgi:aldose 1-epimerase